MTEPVVLSVNVGAPRTTEWGGRLVTSAIWKEPVDGPVALAGVNLDGDDQADRRVHGGPDKAVYAYSVEDYGWWERQVGPLQPGTFGENLTTQGVEINGCSIGDLWRVGCAVLEVSQPRSPCFKLGMRMGDEGFPGRFEAAGRQGCYLRIRQPGAIAAGDIIDIERTATPAIAIGDPRVPDGWRRSAARALARP